MPIHQRSLLTRRRRLLIQVCASIDAGAARKDLRAVLSRPRARRRSARHPLPALARYPPAPHRRTPQNQGTPSARDQLRQGPRCEWYHQGRTFVRRRRLVRLAVHHTYRQNKVLRTHCQFMGTSLIRAPIRHLFSRAILIRCLIHHHAVLPPSEPNFLCFLSSAELRRVYS